MSINTQDLQIEEAHINFDHVYFNALKNTFKAFLDPDQAEALSQAKINGLISYEKAPEGFIYYSSSCELATARMPNASVNLSFFGNASELALSKTLIKFGALNFNVEGNINYAKDYPSFNADIRSLIFLYHLKGDYKNNKLSIDGESDFVTQVKKIFATIFGIK